MYRVFLMILLVIFSLTVKAHERQPSSDTIVTSIDKTIHVNVVAKPFHEVIHDIARQSGRCYVESITAPLGLVTVSIDKAGVYDAVRLVARIYDLEFSITDENIFINLKPGKSSNQGEEKTVTLKGKIVNTKCTPVAGATVSLSNGRKTISGDNGEFEFKNAPPSGSLVVTHVSYNPVTIPYKQEISKPIVLQESNNALDEIVYNGYTSSTRKESVGNVTVVKVDDSSPAPVSNPLIALQGRVAGLFINQSSGMPGGSLDVVVRGKNSIANGRQPLYIIDGVPYIVPFSTLSPSVLMIFDPLSYISLSDIESFTVLKDANATAIYGSRAANGVIVITTKHPKPGLTKLQVNVYGGMGKITRKMDLMNTEQYLQMRHQAIKNDNLQPSSADYDINGTWDTSGRTNWQQQMIGGFAKIVNANVSLSGGTEFTQFRLSGVYRHETMVYPGSFLSRTRSFRSSVNHHSQNQRLQVNFGAFYTYKTNFSPQQEPMRAMFGFPAAPPIYGPGKQLNFQNNTFLNPLAQLLRTSTTTVDHLLSDLYFSYKLFPHVDFRSNFGYTLTQLEDIAITPASSYMPNVEDKAAKRTNGTGVQVSRNYIWEPQIFTDFRIGDAKFEVITGASLQQSKGWNSLYISTNFKNDELISNPGTASHVDPFLERIKYNYISGFSRINVNFKSRYFLNLSARRDGSSRLGPDKMFGTFGAIGAAWIFSNEPFFQDNVSFIRYGKLRGSFGTTGNDQIVGGRYQSVYDADLGYWDEPGLSAQGLTNSAIDWEKTIKSEIAIELETNKGSTANLSIYRNCSTNQLVQSALPGGTGFQSITANIPAKVENTGIELDISHTLIKNNKLIWKTDFNITIPKTKLKAYPDLESSPYAFRLAIGQSLDSRFLYSYIGVDKNTGLYQFAQRKNDGVLNKFDQVPVSFTPSFYGGWNNRIQYRRFSAEVFVYFVKQKGYRATGPATVGMFLSSGANQPVKYLDYWRYPGDDAPYQKPSTSVDANAANTRYTNSTAMVGDASFLRLKSLCISYTLSESTLKKLKVSDAKIYVQGQNLFTLTKFDGMDPETSKPLQTPSLPPLKTINIGLQISL
ncbi:SusC/RagA family TonB-linked outer membrane protein [Chitinophaga sp. CF418]|uniref:SusC/RagA family TonB-linked outer membrane protein n=1 Tax=Chitinophaga sp. CF418 TaxID=1855287 RepID=UPI000910EE5E|nr:SusC/RagA family TonB-linked outer membrane protein [Chitinophaga sp. CF418]SHN45520.1 TonB-linked outer membrane protein, SusC/RagA family [Chitinophaga sp. CF418]